MNELSQDQSILLLSADLSSFYDTVDPSFLLSDPFVDELLSAQGASDRHPLDISEYRAAVQSLLRLYSSFRARAERRTGLTWPIGIPIGALTSRLVANLALSTMDYSIQARESTRCYRRYVDDFVIVARANETEVRDIDQVISNFVPHARKEDSTFRLNAVQLGRNGSEFRIQEEKCKAHYLRGVSGLDFLASVRTDFGRLVSERRAFIDSTVLLGDGLQSLIQAGPPGRPLTVLREADRATLKHFELSTRLQSLERASVLLDKKSAGAVAKRALDEAHRFFSGDHNWVENLEVALRLLRLGIHTGDWEDTEDLSRYMDGLWLDTERLRTATGPLFHGEREITRDSSWVWLRNYLHARRLEAICSVMPADAPTKAPEWLVGGIPHRTRRVQWRGIIRRARLLSAADLRTYDREDDAFGRNHDSGGVDASHYGMRDPALRGRLDLVTKFIEVCEELGDMPWAVGAGRLFLCTRPPSYFDVARRLLYRSESGFRPEAFDELLAIVNAVRGTEYRDPVGSVLDEHTVEIPPGNSMFEGTEGNPQVILGNLVASGDCYEAAAKPVRGSSTGRPILSVERLANLNDILSSAGDRARRYPGGESLLVLPELSLPRAWFRTVAGHVASSGAFGLVVGLEYLHGRGGVFNQVYAVLPGPFRSAATWPWTKRFAAREEDERLRKLGVSFARTGVAGGRRRAVVVSPYGRLSVLICSELIEAQRVADLHGRVEVLAVPSWNRDTASFDHLIQSIGVQLHAVVAVANNGEYSDCRAWAPRKERWERDLCRLIERGVNDVIAVEVPLGSLRASRSGDPFGVGDGGWRPLPPNWR